jgi:hypothetical protein
MTIQCKICQKEFNKQITNSHLKTHSISTTEYKNKFGDNSLSSEDYRNSLSEGRKGENNSNYGKKWSDIQKKELSEKVLISYKNEDRVVWNKGLQITDPNLLESIRKGTNKREEKYKNGELSRPKILHSDTTKDLLRNRQKEYANANPEEMSDRAKKAVITKKENGYFDLKKQNTQILYEKKCKDFGFTITQFLENNLCILTCNNCDSSHIRSISSKTHKNMCGQCSLTGHSRYEFKLKDEILKHVKTTILIGDKTVLNPLELDLYLPEYNIAIEINGLYWHSETCGKNKWYHKYKMDKCREKNIRLIHIFEDEWVDKQEIVIQRILSKLNLNKPKYARNFIVKEIDNKTAKEFLNLHHIQGYGSNSAYHYGLIDNESKLHAVMTFNNLSIAKGSKHIDGVYELNRYASIGNIIGGASKLMKKFITTISPTKIISYSDLRWNTGNLYEKLGFKFSGNTLPNYFYVKGLSRIHRFKLRKKENEPKDITEKELREQQGYHRIWDCGNSKWVWEK